MAIKEKTLSAIEQIYSVFRNTEKHDVGIGILLGAFIADEQFVYSTDSVRYLVTDSSDLPEQCAICSAPVIKWEYRFMSDERAHHFFSVCTCSSGESTVTPEAAEVVRKQRSRARLKEAVANDPELARVRREMEEAHQKAVNEQNEDYLKSVSALHQERDSLADKVNKLLQTVSDKNQRIQMLEYTLDEIAAREDEQEEQAAAKTKIPEIVVPIKIEVRS